MIHIVLSSEQETKSFMTWFCICITIETETRYKCLHLIYYKAKSIIIAAVIKVTGNNPFIRRNYFALLKYWRTYNFNEREKRHAHRWKGTQLFLSIYVLHWFSWKHCWRQVEKVNDATLCNGNIFYHISAWPTGLAAFLKVVFVNGCL